MRIFVPGAVRGRAGEEADQVSGFVKSEFLNSLPLNANEDGNGHQLRPAPGGPGERDTGQDRAGRGRRIRRRDHRGRSGHKRAGLTHRTSEKNKT